MSFSRRSGFFDAPLWLPKASASLRSLVLLSSLNSSNGHLLPFLRIASIRFHNGCWPNTRRRMSGGRNSLPGPKGESRCSSRAFSKLNSYFSNTARLCFVASSVISNLNSGGDGVSHDEPMTCLMRAIRSLGQSKRRCLMVSGSSVTSRCSGSLGKRKGKLSHSPSI